MHSLLHNQLLHNKEIEWITIRCCKITINLGNLVKKGIPNLGKVYRAKK